MFHQDKEGNMIGGGYRVNNLLYQHKMPLFVSVGAGAQSGGGGSGGDGGDDSCEPHFIPDKFSELFRDLAVPAGLFMMPAMFRPRNYAFEVPEAEAEAEVEKSRHEAGESSDSSDDDSDDDSDYKTTKHAPNDIFDTLLSLVEAKERIQHDVKTRRHRMSAMASDNNNDNNKKTKKSSTKRRRMK